MKSIILYLGLVAVLMPACTTALTTRDLSPEALLPGDSFLPGVSGLRFGGQDGELIPGLNEAAVIQLTYNALATATAKSGHQVRFELADFETFYRKDFPHLLLSDLMSVPPKRLKIDYTEVEHSVDGIDVHLGASYEPSWRELENDSSATMREMSNWTYAEIIRLAENDREIQGDDFRETVAVTTFKVRVTFQDEFLDYRSLFVWLANQEGTVRFYPQDTVTDLVDEIWALSPEAAPIAQLLSAGRSGTEPVE